MIESRYDIPAISEKPRVHEGALRLQQLDNEALAVRAVGYFTEMGLYDRVPDKQVPDVQLVSTTALTTLMDMSGRIARGQVGHGVKCSDARRVTDAYLTTAASALSLKWLDSNTQTALPLLKSQLTSERIAQDMSVVAGVTRRSLASSIIGKVLIKEVPGSDRSIGGPGALKQLLEMGPLVRRRYTPIQITAIEILARAAGSQRRLVAKEVKHG